MADHLIIDELKINCLKFISLNIVSFLESSYLEKLVSLPVYLLRDLENFIKIDTHEKFLTFDMKAVEDIEHACAMNLEEEERAKRVILTQDYCQKEYAGIEEMFEEFQFNMRLQEKLKSELCGRVHKFR